MKTSDLCFPLDFKSAHRRIGSTIRPNELNCRFRTKKCFQRDLWAQAIPAYQLATPPRALFLELKILIDPLSWAAQASRFEILPECDKKKIDINSTRSDTSLLIYATPLSYR